MRSLATSTAAFVISTPGSRPGGIQPRDGSIITRCVASSLPTVAVPLHVDALRTRPRQHRRPTAFPRVPIIIIIIIFLFF